MRALLLAIVLACPLAPAYAQEPGSASFRVTQNGAHIGDVSVTLTRDDEGWRIESTGYVGGDFDLTLTQFDARYDAHWRPRFLTMQLGTSAEEAIVHVAMQGTMTRTDVVVPGRDARWGTNRVSPDTILLPDYVFGAYEALAARLATTTPGTDLPLFLVPKSEVHTAVDAVEEVEIQTSTGPIAAKRFSLTVIRAEPTPMTIWIAYGRLVRVDLPLERLSVVRSDVKE
jgi:hypothetical protein